MKGMEGDGVEEQSVERGSSDKGKERLEGRRILAVNPYSQTRYAYRRVKRKEGLAFLISVTM